MSKKLIEDLMIQIYNDINKKGRVISIIKSKYNHITKEHVEEQLLPHRIELKVLWDIYSKAKKLNED